MTCQYQFFGCTGVVCDDDVSERLHSIRCRALKNIIFYMPVYFGKVVSYILKENEKMYCKITKTTMVLNPIALRMAKTPWSFGHSECNRIKVE